MSFVFNKLKEYTETLEKVLGSSAFEVEEPSSFSWKNKVYTNAYVRRAHLDVIDATETKKLYMMHLCIFPKVYQPAPIYGLDLIAGPTKVTGAFHDFSPNGLESHPMLDWFEDQSSKLYWSKKRDLPPWAKEIFSENMIAAGNIQSEFELIEFMNFSINSLKYYLDSLHLYNPDVVYETKLQKYNYTESQNKYCKNQKLNPHTPKVLEALGFEKEEVNDFIHNCLFPEIPTSV